MTQSLTKKAYARGIGDWLQRHGSIQIPTREMLKAACDQASQLIESEPAYGEAVTHEDAMKVGQALVNFNDTLRTQGKIAAAGQAPILGVNANVAVGDMIEKVAREVVAAYDDNPANTSSTVTGKRTDQKNLESASQNAEADLDSHRPEGYAVVGQGNANFSEPQDARVGTEQAHPQAPTGVGGASSNSVTQASKAASVHAALNKLAMGGDAGYAAPSAPAHGSTIVGNDPDQQNLESDSQNAEAAMDMSDRPEGYAVVGQGNAGIGDVSANATTGEESTHPKQQNAGGASSNSVTEAASKMAASRFQRHFQETAKEIEPRLPANMPMQTKVATIKEAMKLEPTELDEFLTKVAAHFQAKPANTVGDMLASIGMVSNGG